MTKKKICINMKTKICIFNDLQKTMILQIQELSEHRYQTIRQANAAMIEYDLPEGTVPYFKVWATGQAFLSYIDPEMKF